MASHKLWVVLLVLDSVFVIVFGGTAAAKVYKYWITPPTQIITRIETQPKKEPKKEKKPETKSPESKPDEAPKKAAEAPKKAPKAPKKAAETPKKAPAPKKAAKTPKKKVRARPIEFRLRAPGAKKVELAGAFLVSTGGKKPMEKKSGNVWSLTIYLKPSVTYRYYFIIDGKRTLDPQNPNKSGKSSVITIP